MIDEKLLDIIKTRRSVRSFDLSKKISKSTIDQIIEAANWAPSACNAQGWHFIIIDKKDLIDYLISMGLSKAKNTPVLIFVFYRKYVKSKPINEMFDDDVQSASASIQNLLLMAHNLNLGATWINGLDLKLIKKVINIPYGYSFIAMIRLGYPKKKKYSKQSRKNNVDSIISYNSFNLPISNLENESQIKREKIINIIKNIWIVKILIKLLPISLKQKILGYKDISSFKVN